MAGAQRTSGDVGTGAPGAAGVGVVAGVAAALGGAGVELLHADAAVEAVVAARWAQAAALGVEAAALCRLVAVYPGCGLRGREPARLGWSSS